MVRAAQLDAPVTPAVAARRLAAQLLAEPIPAATGERGRVETVAATVGRVLAVQAQDLRGLRLAIRSRTTGLTVADVDRALAERRLVVTWLNRGTLHLVRSDDYRWLHALTAPRQETQIRRRLLEEGVSPAEAERGVSLVEHALADRGPLTRQTLRDLFAAAGVQVAGQALIYILILASMRGIVVRGPMAGADQAYVRTRDWLAPDDLAFDRDAALASLAARYLTGHGPADDRDLAAWSGLPLRDARRGLALATADGRVEQVDDGRADVSRRSPDSPSRPDLASLPSRLLGPFDPVLHGWAQRDWATGPHRGIVTVNGIFRPIALVAGQAAGIWTMPGGRVKLAPFAPLASAVADALEAETADVERFYGAAGE